jgi:LacI family transcriptional regulator
MATLRDVAQEAGVSVAAASAVLSGQAEKYRLPPATQERVRAAAATLGYRHNALARGLRRGQSDEVLLLVRDLGTEITMAKMRGIAERLATHGYAAQFCTPPQRPGGVVDQLRRIRSLRPAAVVLDGAGSGEERDALRALVDDGVPTVTLEPIDGLALDCVTVDRAHGAFLATRHLLRQGHKRVALMINRNHPIAVVHQREQGYRRAHRAEKVLVDESLIDAPTAGSFSRESGYELARHFLTRSPRPDALFAANDHAAMGALRATWELGITVPDEVVIVGFDGLPETAFTVPSLTTVAQPVEEVAAVATERLLRHLTQTDATGEPKTFWLKPKLMLRESTEGVKARQSHQ